MNHTASVSLRFLPGANGLSTLAGVRLSNMAFASIVTLLLFYYIRPQDWVPGMSGFNMAKLAVLGGVIGLMQRKRDEPKWEFLSSPQEWAMLIFLSYTVFFSTDMMGTMTDLGVLVVFAFLTLHTLTTEELLERYLQWWLIALIGILVLVMITLSGWDITNSRPMLDIMFGRFCLGTYTLNNPNALGHTLVVLLPLSYFLWFWSRPVLSRLRALVLMVAGVWGVIPTESKGAFMSGAFSFLVAVLFGRKLIVQVIVGLLAVAMGGTIMAMLPRMEQMKRIGNEEGAQGRMLAWQAARGVTVNNMTGVGYKQFHAIIRAQGVMAEKATHSSYVKVGADLGVVGLTMYIGMLMVCGRSLIQYKGLTLTMERNRRALFALLMGICVSGWMLDRAYYTEVFCMIGAVGAYHLISIKSRRQAAAQEFEKQQLEKEKEAAEHQMTASYGLPTDRAKAAASRTFDKAADEEDIAREHGVPQDLKIPGLWTHLGLLDVVAAVIGCYLALQFWDYIMDTIKPT